MSKDPLDNFETLILNTSLTPPPSGDYPKKGVSANEKSARA